MKNRQRTAAFFATLANIPDLAQLSIPERKALVSELARLQPRHVAEARAWAQEPTPLSSSRRVGVSLGFGDSHAPIASEPFQFPPKEKEEIALSNLLEITHNVARQTIRDLLAGRPARLPDPGAWIGQLQGRKVREHYEPRDSNEQLYPALLDILRQTPFPFGRCVVCCTVFLQPEGRGKPRRYCTDSCRAKGVPSAKKKTGYMRQHRQNLRERERLYAQRVVHKEKEKEKEKQRPLTLQERLRLWADEFPRKSTRQLLSLLKRVGQAA